MVDMKATNLKLMERARRIVMESTGCDINTAAKTLESTDYNSKTAIVMILAGITKEEAMERIIENHGFIRRCIR